MDTPTPQAGVTPDTPSQPPPRQRDVPLPEAGDPRLPVVRPPTPPDAPDAPPKRRWWVWGLGLIAAGAVALALTLQPWVAAPMTVEVETAALAPVTRLLAVTGRIAARDAVDVRALVGGTLTDLDVAEGTRVTQGDVMARLDAATPQAMLRQAVAGLDAALVAQAQATDTLARTEALGANVARTALDAAARAAQTAAQEVARTTALVEQARAQLAPYTIRAPMTGTVLTLAVTRGQSIDPTTPLMTIADLENLVVEADVDEGYATQIHVDLPAIMQLAGETLTRPGRVAQVSQRVDPATGGLAVEMQFDAPVQAPIGLTVTINIIVDRVEAAVTVPRAAILSGDGGAAVLVVTDGVARRRPVSVIDWPAARLIVTEGLDPGAVVIVDATGLSDGQAVRVGQP